MRVGRTLALILVATACGQGDAGGGAEAAVERGRNVYKNVCIACHNADPAQEGSIGPAVAGSSRELLYAKIVEGRYPPGYQPKRGDSATMPRLQYLEGSIGDLAAYLAQGVEPGAQGGD